MLAWPGLCDRLQRSRVHLAGPRSGGRAHRHRLDRPGLNADRGPACTRSRSLRDRASGSARLSADADQRQALESAASLSATASSSRAAAVSSSAAATVSTASPTIAPQLTSLPWSVPAVRPSLGPPADFPGREIFSLEPHGQARDTDRRRRRKLAGVGARPDDQHRRRLGDLHPPDHGHGDLVPRVSSPTLTTNPRHRRDHRRDGQKQLRNHLVATVKRCADCNSLDVRAGSGSCPTSDG